MEKYNRDLARIAKGGGFSALGDFFTVFSRLMMLFFTARLFSGDPNLVGLFEWAFRFIFFIRIIALPGTSEAIRRFLPIYRSDNNQAAVKGLLLYAIKLTAILSGISTAAVILFAPQICRLLNMGDAVAYLRIMAITLPFYAFLSIAVSAFTGIHRVQYQVVLEKLFVNGFRILILLGFLFISSDSLRNLAVVWSYPIAFGIACIISLIYFFRIFNVIGDGSVKPEYHKREFIKFSLPLAASQNIAYLMNYAGTFILGYYWTSEQVGLYGMVTHFSPVLIIPLFSAIVVFGPLISELYHLGRKDELSRHYKFITKWVFTISLLVFILYALMTRPILSILGTRFTGIKTQVCLIIVCLAQLFNASTGPNGVLISMTGKPRINMYNNAILMVVSVILCILLIPLKGAMGGIIAAGMAQAIAVVGVNILYLFQVWHFHKTHPFSIGYFKPIIAGVISTGIILGLMYITGFREYAFSFDPHGFEGYATVLFNIALIGSVLVIIFGVILYYLGFEEDDKFVLGKLLGKIRNIRLKRRADANSEYHGRD
jgi:O-antigen/teichoic acid export membrane protein